MKLAFVFPPLGHAGSRVRSMPLVPPVLEYLAGLATRLRPSWDLALVNANVEPCDPDALDADVVGISVLTHQASWAYRTADALRRRGARVLLGGPHPSVRPDEASLHCDAVVVGEAEGILGTVFSDLEQGRLLRRYEGTFLPIEDVPHPRRDLAKGVFHSFFTSRGCPYSCRFCATPTLHGHRMRYRPIDAVVADLASYDHKLWFSTDADAWGPDVDRYVELFRAMAKALPRINWVGEASLSSVQHPRGEELLKWARRSGLMQVWVGWESFSDDTLREYGATSKMLSGREDALKRIRDAGIDVVLFLMLGARGEPLDEYARALEMCDRLVVTPHPVMVVPYPGTRMYEDLRDAITCGDDWDDYDGLHAIVPQAAADHLRREELLMGLWRESFSSRRILRRLARLSWRGFPSAHIASGIVQAALRKAFSEHAASSAR
jgi:radical SAM superfamily enzyme YgiQ (UPF0313 family)